MALGLLDFSRCSLEIFMSKEGREKQRERNLPLFLLKITLFSTLSNFFFLGFDPKNLEKGAFFHPLIKDSIEGFYFEQF